ncbi:DUF6638 family protein [Nitratireductor pacificus]|uniref:Uncharacterized protein n=1 Tax=Nitratireductor pacificus pht-3B TaxID=391937 RepID=K2MZK5_9HYPH|nr:DUF6638 family protein [Nitratireductor pacificus]EKF17438.1 hypothetical protein NA2_18036 [Nitratireductor pacificus pht-3B]
MKLLRDNDLIFGRLLKVDEPHLIERYNRALKAFGVRETKLKSFDIDRTGFSPQVAEELKDEQYLDPNGVNRRFIVLTPAQIDLPVVHTAFSNTSQLVYEFMAANARAINAITIKDVVYGEIEEQVNQVRDIEDLLSIVQVEFKVLSAEDLLGKAAELGRLADKVKHEPDAWRDDALLNRMVALAQDTGDIRENKLVPEQVVFRHDAYWTSHFGGVYIFADRDTTTVIADPATPGFRRSRPWQVSYLPKDDPARIFRFLAETGRIQLPRASWIEGSGYLVHRAEMALTDLVRRANPDQDFSRVDPVWLQTWTHRNADLVTRDGVFPFLNAAVREIGQTGRLKVEEIPPHLRFLVTRAEPEHPDAWLTNRLISDFVPSDFIARYVFNKQGFYRDYEDYSQAWREYVVARLKTTYLRDKPALRKRLYGL